MSEEGSLAAYMYVAYPAFIELHLNVVAIASGLPLVGKEKMGCSDLM